MTLSPDASAIAMVGHRPRMSSALVLLHAITCEPLLRINLPSTFSNGSTVSSSKSPIYFITAGYRRVHHLSYLALPITIVTCVINPAPILFWSSPTSLVLLLPRLAFSLIKTSFDQVVANCDVPMQSLLGISQSAVVVSL